MDIRNPSHLLSPSVTAASVQQPASLKLGSVFDVMVQARLGENQFQLQQLSDGVLLTGFSSVELPLGHKIQVQVIRLGATPELRIMPTATQADEALPQALRELLPKQVAIGELTKMMGRLPIVNLSSLPDSIRLAAESLTAVIPKLQQLETPEGLQKAIRGSGLFLEASLAALLSDATAPLLENDLKARLLSLLAVLQESRPRVTAGNKASQLPENTAPLGRAASSQVQNRISGHESANLDGLLQKAEGALAKVTLDQLASLPRDNGSISLQLNIPFTQGTYEDNAKLAIASDGSAARDKNSLASWTASIELQPPGIGKFNARIVWTGTRIDACLWSDREETGSLMRDYCEQLRARLEQAGLETGNITVLDHPPMLPSSDANTLPLLDLRV